MASLGNVIVGQSGGPTAVINASLAGVLQAARESGAKRVFGMRNGIQGLLVRRIFDLGARLPSDLDLELLRRTPSSFLGSCRFKLPDPDDNPALYEELFAFLGEQRIGAFLYIGGNDSMDAIGKLSRYGESVGSEIRFIGVPKTIDNDLEGTDHTPGYGSAAKYIATITKEVVQDSLVYDERRVTILEIMGRNTGWLTGACALAEGEDCEGADLIYLPETAFDFEKFTEQVAAMQKRKKSLVIGVSEGIRTADGAYVCEQTALNPAYADAFGHRDISGTARSLATHLSGKLGCKTRAIEVNVLQRCAAHLQSQTDVNEAFVLGQKGVLAALSGSTGRMMTLARKSENPYFCDVESCPVEQAANHEKKVPRNWINATANGLSPRFVAYARPLVQGEQEPIYVGGLPKHIRL